MSKERDVPSYGVGEMPRGRWGVERNPDVRSAGGWVVAIYKSKHAAEAVADALNQWAGSEDLS